MSKGLFRISSTPGKTLLWLLLKNDLKKVKGELGIDLAGGGMLNKSLFKTRKYISVDINQIKLSEGLEAYQDAVAINDTIQNYLLKTDDRPDLLVCVQTFGTNMFFEHNETVEVIENMSKKLKVGGSMAFNVGIFGDMDLEELKNKLEPFLKARFKNTNFKFYGALHKRFKLPRWKQTENGMEKILNETVHKVSFLKKLKNLTKGIFMLSLAFIMYILPPLRNSFGKKNFFLYCFCSEKL